MGDFDKKKAFGIGGSLGLTGLIAVLANLSEIGGCVDKTLDRFKKPENTTSVVETVEKITEEKAVIEQAEDIKEDYAEEVEEVLPTEPQPSVVYLDSMKVADSRHFNCFYGETAEDTVGNMYSGHVDNIGQVGFMGGEESYVTYYLGGKYKTLNGIIAVNDKTTNNGNGEILIYCDDNIIYQTGAVVRATAPITMPELNVEGCQWLKISVASYSKADFGYATDEINFILSNFKLEE
ncbi:MAG: NPCBM/NEW2 domain-containing protein [Ruminococcus sp.]|nr:NPCBM/NEW2 domain-containing protein [Ruminococcus sp.]